MVERITEAQVEAAFRAFSFGIAESTGFPSSGLEAKWQEGKTKPEFQFGLTAMRAALAAALSTEPGEAEGMVLVPLDDLLFAYRGLLVLRTICKKEKLTGGLEATDEIIAQLGKIAPHLVGLSALRAAPTSEGSHHG